MSELTRIITADCSYPKEIDDGLFVARLDENHELYKVNICVADTSKIYSDQDVVAAAHARTAAKYWDLPDGERGYDPMIDPEIIADIQLTAGTIRDALVVSFLIGQKQPPSEVEISFQPVEIASNQTYKEFANFAAYGKGREYLRASDLIKTHLGYVAYGDHVGSRPLWRQDGERVADVSGSAWKRGSKINEAFMVAANHLVGKVMAAEHRPAIYRVHDPENEQYLELASPNVALYSRKPGPHMGLRLDPYCRVTSPLRRLDDFVMSHQLRQRFLGRQPTAADEKEVAFAVRRLNQEVIAAAPKEVSRYSKRDILGRLAGQTTVISAAG